MKIRLTIDRFEGDDKAIAVLLADDGATINFPRSLLPKGSKAGDILSFTIARDLAATREVAEKTKAIQDDLRKADPGGDIKL
jgi:hypothetical protein